MAGPVKSPLALQSILGDIGGRRALAMALRAQEQSERGGMVSGKYVPSFRGVGGALARGMFGDPLDALRQEEQGAYGAYEAELGDAMSGIVGAGMDMPDADFGRTAARAQTAGVPQEVITRALQRRESYNTLDGLLSRLDAPPAGGGASPGGGGVAPGAVPAPPSGAPQAPMPAPGGPGNPAVARAFAPQGGGTPLANVPDGKLVTMAAMLEPGEPMAKLAAAELEARKITVKDGVITRQGRAIGKIDGGYFHDLQTGQTHDLTGGMDAQRAGQKKGAEVAAEFPYRTVETRDAQGRQVTTFANHLPGAPGARSQAAGGKIKVNFEGTPEEVMRAVQAAIDDANRAGAAAVGTGPDPIEQKRRETEIEVDAAGKKKQREAQVADGARRYEEITKAYQGAQDMRPIVARMRELDAAGVMTGPAQEGWKALVNVANSAVPGLKMDAKRLANSQTFDAEISKMVQGIAKNFPGAQSDRELQQLLNSLPNRGQSPEARRMLYDALEARIAKFEDSYRGASKAFGDRGDLLGWEPPVPGTLAAPAARGGSVLRFDAQGNQIK